MKFTYDDINFYSYLKLGDFVMYPLKIDKDLNIIKFMINQYKKQL